MYEPLSVFSPCSSTADAWCCCWNCFVANMPFIVDWGGGGSSYIVCTNQPNCGWILKETCWNEGSFSHYSSTHIPSGYISPVLSCSTHATIARSAAEPWQRRATVNAGSRTVCRPSCSTHLAAWAMGVQPPVQACHGREGQTAAKIKGRFRSFQRSTITWANIFLQGLKL